MRGNAQKKMLLAGLALFGALAAFLVIYFPDVGRGFLKDDFSWIIQSRIGSWQKALIIFRQAQGFYRPIVALTFAADFALFGLHPLGYGLTNLAFLLGAAVAMGFLGKRLGLGSGTAVFAAALWLFNPHGISMGVLWLSGRTSLLLTLFSLLAALSFFHNRKTLTLLFFFFALLSKEDAVLLPFILFAMVMIFLDGTLREKAVKAWFLCRWQLLPLGVYLILRFSPATYLPFSAPEYYRFSTNPLVLLRNTWEYFNRSVLFAIFVGLAVMFFIWRLPRLESQEKKVALAGLIWMVGGFGLTVFLPVRSSLYAVFPAAGGVLAIAAVVESIWRQGESAGRLRVLVEAMLLPWLLVPIFRQRNNRWTGPADKSQKMILQLRRLRGPLKAYSRVVIRDRSHAVGGIASTFGAQVRDAVQLALGGRFTIVWLEPPRPTGGNRG